MTIETAQPPIASATKKLSWQQIVKPYQSPDNRQSIIQVLTSIPPFFVMWYVTYRSLALNFYPVTLFLAFLTAMFAMRSFIILHDAGHGSFVKDQRINDALGIISGFITFTPYFAWRHTHAVHHASSGDLDRRGVGDVWTLTYDEYHKMPLAKRAFYRLYRNPLVIFGVGPTIDFVILQRLPTVNTSNKAREKYSVIYTNITLLVVCVGLSLLIGVKDFVLVQLPVIAFASSLGVFLFYVQHQFEDAYWARHKDWNYSEAALHGSSFFKMGPIMKFFTGNIGFHHIHHLSPKIPNYKLEACHYDNEMFQEVAVMTWRSSLKSIKIRTFDEDHGKMIGYHRAESEDGVEEPVVSADLPATPGMLAAAE